MEFTEYTLLVKNLSIGKRLPTAIYLHSSALIEVTSLHNFVQQVIQHTQLEDFDFTLVKFYTLQFQLSLLNYLDFFEHPYPILQKSHSINLITCKYRTFDYTRSSNPPILHRKETFLAPSHPCVPQFRQYTQELETAGLFHDIRRIGYKNQWETLLQQHGYSIYSPFNSPEDWLK